MKYLHTYKIFESSNKIKFVKLSKKKNAKTDIFNVLKDNFIIGQIKWSSRVRGYSFLPTTDCADDVKEFIKNLMSERRLSKK